VEENGEATGNFLCGVSPTKEKDHAVHDMTGIDYADHELWDETIWPSLYHRVPAFGEVKLKSSWAGLYECEYSEIKLGELIDPICILINVVIVFCSMLLLSKSTSFSASKQQSVLIIGR
jgi:FAD-dependent oxidoreductase domain-containing protein 1